MTLEQFIPHDIRKTLIKLSTDNLFSQFNQKKNLIGTCERQDDLKHIFADINSTHITLNEQGMNPVPDTLAPRG